MASGLQQLIEKYGREIAQLETRIEETKRKRNVLVEASRLLREEALTHSRTLYEKLSEADRERSGIRVSEN